MDRKLKTVIIDDEPDAIEQLRQMLVEFKEFEVTETFQETTNLLPYFKNAETDLLFLDIQMPGQNGIDLLKELSALENPPRVVMVTAYEQHMLNAFRNSAFDYLLKPIDREEFSQCLNRIKSVQEKSTQNFRQLFSAIQNKVRIPGVYETHFIDPDEIIYLQADGRYTDVYLTNGKHHKITTTLGKMNETILSDRFKRISRSVIINTQYLFKLDHKRKTCHLHVNERKLELTFSKKYF